MFRDQRTCCIAVSRLELADTVNKLFKEQPVLNELSRIKVSSPYRQNRRNIFIQTNKYKVIAIKITRKAFKSGYVMP